MKNLYVTILVALMASNSVAFATESVEEKTTDQVNDIKRDANSKVNRLEEAVCMESDTACLKEKAMHRVEESKDAIKDKTNEFKNSIDKDDKAQ